MMITLILLCSTINTGDVSHAQAIADQFTKMSSTITITVEANLTSSFTQERLQKEIDDTFASIPTDDENSKVILLAVGEKGLTALSRLDLKTLKETRPKTMIAASLHQFFDSVAKLPLDFLSIPQAALDTAYKKAILSSIPSRHLTIGVPTKQLSIPELKRLYEEWVIEPKPDLSTPKIIIMLPGDAPDETGKQQLFTETSAQQLFDNIYNLWITHGSKHNIFIQNGPRTGKFSADGEIICPHEYRKTMDDPVIAIDHVSRYFIRLLEEKGIPHTFFNFAFVVDEEKRASNSVYNQLLFTALANKENYFIVPAESVSMLSQIPFYLDPGQVIIFKPSSMNKQHLAILEVVMARGHCCAFDERNNGTIECKGTLVKMKNDDAVDVAQAIIKAYMSMKDTVKHKPKIA